MRRLFFLLIPLLLPGFVDRIAGVVGREPILLSELQLRLLQAGGDSLDEESYNRYLEEFIQEELILLAAEKESIVVDDEELEERFSAYWTDFIRRYGSFESLRQELEAQGYDLSSFRYKMRALFRKNIIKARFVEIMFPPTVLSRDEVREFYELYRDSIPEFPALLELDFIDIHPFIDTSIASDLADCLTGGNGEVCNLVTIDTLRGVERGSFKPILDSLVFSLDAGTTSEPLFVDSSVVVVVKPISSGKEARDVVLLKAELLELPYIKIAVDSVYFALKSGEDLSVVEQKVPLLRAEITSVEDFPVDSLSGEERKFIMSYSPGDFLPPIRIENSYRIIHLKEYHPPRQLDFNTDYEIIKNIATAEDRKRKLIDYLENFGKDIYIERRPYSALFK